MNANNNHILKYCAVYYLLVGVLGYSFAVAHVEELILVDFITLLQSLIILFVLSAKKSFLLYVRILLPLIIIILWILMQFYFYHISHDIFEFRKSDSYEYFRNATLLLSGQSHDGVIRNARYEFDDFGIVYLHFILLSIFESPFSIKIFNLGVHFITINLLMKFKRNDHVWERLVISYAVSGVGIFYAASGLKETVMVFLITVIVLSRKTIIKLVTIIMTLFFRSVYLPLYVTARAFTFQPKVLIIICIFLPAIFDLIAEALSVPTRFFVLKEFDSFTENKFVNYILFLYFGIAFTPTTFCFDCLPNFNYANFTILTNLFTVSVALLICKSAIDGRINVTTILFVLIIIILAYLERTLKIRYIVPFVPIALLLVHSSILNMSSSRHGFIIFNISALTSIVMTVLWNSQYG